MKNLNIKLSLAISAILSANLATAVDVNKSQATTTAVSGSIDNASVNEITKLRASVKKAKKLARKLKGSLFSVQEEYYVFKDESESDIKKKAQYIDELKESNISLIKDYEDNMRAASINIANLEKSVFTLTSTSTSAETALAAKAKEIETLITSAKTKDEEVKNIIFQLDAATIKMTGIGHQVSMVKEQNYSLTATIEDLEAGKAAALSDFETAKVRLAKAVDKLSKLENLDAENKIEFSAMARLLESSAAEAGILRAEIIESTENVSKQQSEIDILKDSIANSNKLNQDLNSDIQAKAEEIDRLVSELEDRQDVVVNIASSAQHIALIKKYETSMRESSLHINNLYDDLMGLTEKNKSIANELANAKAEKSILESTTNKNQAKVQDLAKQISELSEKNKDFEKTIAAKTQQLTTQANKVVDINSLRKDYEASNKTQLSLIEKYEADVMEGRVVVDNLLAKVKGLEESKDSIGIALTKKSEELSRLNTNSVDDASVLSGLSEKIANLETKNKEIKHDLATKASKIDSLLSKVKKQTKKIAKLKGKQRSLMSVVSDVENDLFESKDEVSLLESNISKLTKKVSSLQDSSALIETQLNSKKAQLDEIKLALSDAESTASANDGSHIELINKYEADMGESSLYINKLTQEIEAFNVQKELADAQLKDSMSEIQKLNNSSSGYAAKYKALSAEVLALKEENKNIFNNLAAAMKEKSHLSKSIGDDAESISNFEADNSAKVAQIKKYEADMSESNAYISKLKTEIEGFRIQRDIVAKQLDAGKERIKGLSASESDYEAKYKGLSTEVLALKVENNNILNNLASALANVDSLSNVINDNKEAIYKIESNNSAHIALIKKSEADMGASSAYISKLSKEIISLSNKNAAMQTQIAAGKAKITEVLNAATKNTETTDGLDKINAEMADLKSKIDILKAANSAQKIQINEVLSNSATHQAAAAKNNSIIAKLKENIYELDSSLGKEKNISAELKSKIAGLEGKVDSINNDSSKIEALLAEVDEIKAELSRVRSTSNSKNEKLITEIKTLMASKSKIDKEIATQSDKLESSKKRVGELTRLLDSERTSTTTATERAESVVEYQERISKLEDENFNMVREIKKLDSENSKDIEIATSKISKLKVNIAALEKATAETKEKTKTDIESLKKKHLEKTSILTSRVESITATLKTTKKNLRENILQMDSNSAIVKALSDSVKDLKGELSSQDSTYSNIRTETNVELSAMKEALEKAQLTLEKELLISERSKEAKNDKIDDLLSSIATLKNKRSQAEIDMILITKEYENKIVDVKKRNRDNKSALESEKSNLSIKLAEAEVQVSDLTEKLHMQQILISDKATEIHLVNKQLSSYAANPGNNTHSSVINLINALDRNILTKNIYDKDLLNPGEKDATENSRRAISTLRSYDSGKVSERIQNSIDSLVIENGTLDSGNRLLAKEIDKLKANLKVSLTSLANERAESRRLLDENKGLNQKVENLNGSVDLLNTYERTIQAFKKDNSGARERSRKIIKDHILKGQYWKAKTIHDSMDYVSRYNSQEEEEMNNIFMFLSGSANRIVAEADMSLIMDVRISNYIIKTLTDKLQENKKLLNLISHIDLANISKDDVLRNKINVYIKVGNLTESLSLSSRIAKPTKDDKNIREFIEKTLHSIEKIFSINLIN